MKELFKYKNMSVVFALCLQSTTTKILIPCILILSTFQSGCKKLIEVDLPIDKNTKGTVYSKSSTASLAMIGVYAAMGNIGEGSLVRQNSGISISASLLADDLSPSTASSPQISRFYFNNLDGDMTSVWNDSYQILLFRINSIIEGVSGSQSIPNDKKAILLGEAKFTRAFIYFNLINLYGDVPLVLTTDFKVNANIPRTSADNIYEQIIKDLIEAQASLTDNYIGLDIGLTTSERIRPNKAAATALLARVHLFQKNWAQAEAEANKIIALTGTYHLNTLNEVFLKNSNETIWALQPAGTDDGTNTPDGRLFINTTYQPGYSSYVMNSQLLNSFETGDLRKDNWSTVTELGYQVPFKYKVGTGDFSQPQTEYTIVLRLAEVYLIRAEARAQQGNIFGAEQDLKGMRERAGLGETGATTQAAMLDAILHERQVELFTEWGHRWFDIKRNDERDELMTTIQEAKVAFDGTTGTWAPYKALMPIPYTEFMYNPALDGHQNPGYSQQP